MKRKLADRPGWRRILQKRYKQTFVSDENFRGHLSFLYLDRVTEPLWVEYSKEDRFRIVDDGYVWMLFFPVGANWALTTMMNDRGEPLQWYFDIVKNIGLTEAGIPYLDDLYLDVVALPNGKH